MRLLYGASFLLLAALVFAGPDNAHTPTRKPRAVDGHLRHRRGPSSKCPARKSPAPPAPSPAPAPARTGCFPSLKFKMPDNVPDASVLPNQWWCNQGSEYAFLGFSYSVALCQSRSQLTREFSDIRNRFKGRYVRLYGACDRKGFYNDVVEAAWSAGIGVHALIWFGFDGSGIWKTRRDALFAALHSNPKAKFVTRVVQFGSEPLYDHVLPPATLASQVNAAKAALADLHIPVTVSDMAHGYEIHGGAQPVVNADSFFRRPRPPLLFTQGLHWQECVATCPELHPVVLRQRQGKENRDFSERLAFGHFARRPT